MKTTNNILKRLSSAGGLLKKSFAIASLMLLGTGAAMAQTSNPIGVSGLAGDFEIDADFIANTCTNPNICSGTGTDWRSVLRQNTPPDGYAIPGESNVAGENAVWIVDGNSGSGVSAANMEVETFAGTSNKNGDFITIGAKPYSIDTSNPSAPQKNDLTNIYVRSKEVAGDTWLVMGAETRSVDGTSYLDFEYNQAGIEKSLTQMYGPISLASTGGRTAKTPTTAGDALFVVDFSKGGGVPIPKVFEWDAVTKGGKTTYGSVEKDIDDYPNLTFIVTNGNDVDSPGDNTAFTGDGSATSTVEALQFVEMGVNLTELFGNFDVCAPEATMLVKTRTSSSYTSELKDFSLFNFAITAPALMEDIDDVAVCPSETATFEATVSGPGADPANVIWYKVTTPDDLSTPLVNEEVLVELADGDDGGDISISYTGLTSTLEIANVASGDEGTYKAKLFDATCGEPEEYADLTLNSVDAPIVTLLEPSVCEARATGLLTVCNILEGANYFLNQLDENGDTIAAYYQLEADFSGSSLTFDLVPGYKFRLRVEKDGCEATATCLDVVEECPAADRVQNPKTDPNQHSENPIDNSDLRQGQTNAQALTAYPVPFTDKVTIEFTSAKTEHYVINLYDIQGKMVKQLKSGKAKAGDVIRIEVDGQGMVDSMYMARKVSKSGVSTIKLLKKE